MQWIEVKDKFPKNREIVLVVDEISSVISLARFREFDEPINFEDDDFFEVMNLKELEIDYSVTHWMPLPKPPNF